MAHRLTLQTNKYPHSARINHGSRCDPERSTDITTMTDTEIHPAGTTTTARQAGERVEYLQSRGLQYQKQRQNQQQQRQQKGVILVLNLWVKGDQKRRCNAMQSDLLHPHTKRPRKRNHNRKRMRQLDESSSHNSFAVLFLVKESLIVKRKEPAWSRAQTCQNARRGPPRESNEKNMKMKMKMKTPRRRKEGGGRGTSDEGPGRVPVPFRSVVVLSEYFGSNDGRSSGAEGRTRPCRSMPSSSSTSLSSSAGASLHSCDHEGRGQIGHRRSPRVGQRSSPSTSESDTIHADTGDKTDE